MGYLGATSGGGSSGAANPSVGPTGAPVPAQATQIGGPDENGNLRALPVTDDSNIPSAPAGVIIGGLNGGRYFAAQSTSGGVLEVSANQGAPIPWDVAIQTPAGFDCTATEGSVDPNGRVLIGFRDGSGNVRIPDTANPMPVIDATVAALQVAQGSVTAGQKGTLILGASTTAPVSSTNAQSAPLSLVSINSALRVDLTSIQGVNVTPTPGIPVQYPVVGTAAALADGKTNTVNGLLGSTTASASSAIIPITYNYVFNGATWDRLRTGVSAHQASTTTTGATVWTPAVGKKFRLMKFKIQVTGNASLAAAAVVNIRLQDAAAGMNLDHQVFIGNVAGAGLLDYDSGWITLDNGILSAAANNALQFNLSGATLATGQVNVIAFGTEE